MKIKVVSVTNRIPGSSEPYYRYNSWLESVRRFGVEPTVLGLHDPEFQWRGLMSKPREIRRWLRSGECNAECIIFTDSWDCCFLKHPDEIASEWESIGKPFVVGCEVKLFPPDDERLWPQSGTPYRFLNSGCIISSPKDMLSVLELMELDTIPDDYIRDDGSEHHGNDQKSLQEFFLSGKFPILLDTSARFVWNLCDVPDESYERIDGKVFNRDTKTFPGVAHANGSSKQGSIFLDILKNLNLL